MKKPSQIFIILLLFMASFGFQKFSIPNEEVAKFLENGIAKAVRSVTQAMAAAPDFVRNVG